MKKYLIPMLACALTMSLFPALSQAETDKDHARLYYIRVAPGKFGEYRSYIMENWTKVAQARADAGSLTAWYFLRSVIPRGEAATCDFLVIDVMKGGFDAKIVPLKEALEMLGSEKTSEELWEPIRAMGTLVNSEIWYSFARAGESEAGNYMLINYMDVHKMNDWLEIEREIVLPSMQARVDDGVLQAWSAHQLFLPRGTSLSYNAGTVDVFTDWSSIDDQSGGFVTYIEKVHPDIKFSELGPRLQEARDLVRGDLYEILAKVTPSADAK